MLEQLTRRTGTVDVKALVAISEGLELSTPRGTTRFHNRHTIKNIYLAEAEGLGFKIIETFAQVPPL